MKMLVAICITLLPAVAWAHPGHGGSGFVTGLAHPFSGLDHIIGMLTVGIWAARNSGIRRWIIPAVFLCGMLGGGMLGLDGYLPSFIESAVAASVMASALLVGFAVRRAYSAAVACLAICCRKAIAIAGLAQAWQ